MPGFQGAETEQLRQAGAATAGGAARLADLATRLGALIDSVDWQGHDADGFRADWSGGVRPGLWRCEQRLQEDARTLHGHAEEQDACSEADGLWARAVGHQSPWGGMPGARVLLGWMPGAEPLRSAPGAEPPRGSARPRLELGDLQLMSAVTPLGLSGAEVSEAIGTDELVFDDTGMRLSPPEVQASVAVDSDHDLTPGDSEQPFGFDADGEPLELAPSTRYDVGEHGVYYTDEDGQVAYVEATGGGEEMNPNLREVFPDATYHVNESTFYQTDELGRTEHLFVPEVIVDRDMARSQSIQSKIAERWDMVGDDTSEPVEFNAGHVLARQLGGIREEINYTRQWDEVNQARGGKDTIYTYEALMADGITDNGSSFTYETRVTWGDEQPSGVGPEHGSEPWEYVPESYDVRIDQDGERIVDAHLENYPEGARFPD